MTTKKTDAQTYRGFLL